MNVQFYYICLSPPFLCFIPDSIFFFSFRFISKDMQVDQLGNDLSVWICLSMCVSLWWHVRPASHPTCAGGLATRPHHWGGWVVSFMIRGTLFLFKQKPLMTSASHKYTSLTSPPCALQLEVDWLLHLAAPPGVDMVPTGAVSLLQNLWSMPSFTLRLICSCKPSRPLTTRVQPGSDVLTLSGRVISEWGRLD